MKHAQLFSSTAAALGMLILILDGKTAVSGAAEGISLCIQVIIPSLFPFILLSTIVTRSLMGTPLSVLQPIRKLLGMPEGTEGLLISGFLGGYPVGAQAAASAFRSGQLPKEDASRILAFCNNAGPAFLFGMVRQQFSSAGTIWLLWGIHILSAVFTGILLPSPDSFAEPMTDQKHIRSDALLVSLRATGLICGWVILFRILIAFLERWFLWLLPPFWKVSIIGLLELTNGCHSLPLIADPKIRFILCSCMLSMGGLCVMMQTYSVTTGLSLRYYWIGKLLQALFSLLLSLAIAFKSWFLLLLFLPVILFFAEKSKKMSSFRVPSGV